jgi:hypothetical protein
MRGRARCRDTARAGLERETSESGASQCVWCGGGRDGGGWHSTGSALPTHHAAKPPASTCACRITCSAPSTLATSPPPRPRSASSATERVSKYRPMAAVSVRLLEPLQLAAMPTRARLNQCASSMASYRATLRCSARPVGQTAGQTRRALLAACRRVVVRVPWWTGEAVQNWQQGGHDGTEAARTASRPRASPQTRPRPRGSLLAISKSPPALERFAACRLSCFMCTESQSLLLAEIEGRLLSGLHKHDPSDWGCHLGGLSVLIDASTEMPLWRAAGAGVHPLLLLPPPPLQFMLRASGAVSHESAPSAAVLRVHQRQRQGKAVLDGSRAADSTRETAFAPAQRVGASKRQGPASVCCRRLALLAASSCRLCSIIGGAAGAAGRLLERRSRHRPASARAHPCTAAAQRKRMNPAAPHRSGADLEPGLQRGGLAAQGAGAAPQQHVCARRHGP